MLTNVSMVVYLYIFFILFNVFIFSPKIPSVHFFKEFKCFEIEYFV